MKGRCIKERFHTEITWFNGIAMELRKLKVLTPELEDTGTNLKDCRKEEFKCFVFSNSIVFPLNSTEKTMLHSK